jgi:hypothetical protein
MIAIVVAMSQNWKKKTKKASCVHSAVVGRPDSQFLLMEYP